MQQKFRWREFFARQFSTSTRQRYRWRRYGFEFLSIFIAVVAAFALNNWNDNRREYRAGEKILSEIENGLRLDEKDINENILGHELGIKACSFWQAIVQGDTVSTDSFMVYNYSLLRDYVTLQNGSGYQTLQSKGLELIDNDDLRERIITLYAYHYVVLRKLEEEYAAGQYFKTYYSDFNSRMAPHMIFNKDGYAVDLELPIRLPQAEQRLLLSHLAQIKVNRQQMLFFYKKVRFKLQVLRKLIRKELGKED